MMGHMVLQHLCSGFVSIIVSNKGITTCLPHIKLIEYNTPSLADFGLSKFSSSFTRVMLVLPGQRPLSVKPAWSN